MKALLTFHTLGGEHANDIIALNSIVIEVEEVEQLDKIVANHESCGINVRANVLDATPEQHDAMTKYATLALLLTTHTDAPLANSMLAIKSLQRIEQEYNQLILAKNTDTNMYGQALQQLHKRLGVANQTEAIQKLNKVLSQPNATEAELKKQLLIANQALYEIANGVVEPLAHASLTISRISQRQQEFNTVNRE